MWIFFILFFFVFFFCFFYFFFFFFFFSSRRRHTRSLCDWSSDVCSSDLLLFFIRLRSSCVAGFCSGGLQDHGRSQSRSCSSSWQQPPAWRPWQIGRASCRERV